MKSVSPIRCLLSSKIIFVSLFVTFNLGTCFGSDDLKPIFDGKTFNGWTNYGNEKFSIEDGVIVGRTGAGKQGWLCTMREYGDFILELDVNVTAGNSGVQVRSKWDLNRMGDHMVGTQIEVDPSERAWSGGLYDQARRGWLQNLTNNPAARAAFKVGEWNKYRVECKGDSIKSWVNGVPATDYIDAMDLNGIIALQIHGGTNVEVRFRDIRIEDLGKHEWKPLWDGKTFNGWQTNSGAEWKIKNGALHGTSSTNHQSQLISEKSYSDFVIRLNRQLEKGGAQIALPSIDLNNGHSTVLVAVIGGVKTGSLIFQKQGAGKTTVFEPDPANIMKWMHPDDWNSFTLYAHPGRFALDVNGYRTAETGSMQMTQQTLVLFQLLQGLDSEIYLKDIEILEKVK